MSEVRNEVLKAAKMIEEAMVISRLSYKDAKFNPNETKPLFEMTNNTAELLYHLLTKDDEMYQANVDWAANCYDWKEFMKHIIVLFSDPVIAASLPKNAARMMFQLYNFFDRLTGEYTNTEEWLTWFVLTDHPDSTSHWCQAYQQIYDLKNYRETNNHFHYRGEEKIKNMLKVYPVVHAHFNNEEK